MSCTRSALVSEQNQYRFIFLPLSDCSWSSTYPTCPFRAFVSKGYRPLSYVNASTDKKGFCWRFITASSFLSSRKKLDSWSILSLLLGAKVVLAKFGISQKKTFHSPIFVFSYGTVLKIRRDFSRLRAFVVRDPIPGRPGWMTWPS